MAVLRDNEMNYLIIQVTNDDVAKGLVISQTPASGSEAKDDSAVTLIVSRGPTTTTSPTAP